MARCALWQRLPCRFANEACSMRRLLFRTHIWLGWIVGAQLILWMLSGLVMTAMPIEEVRGEHLRREHSEPALAGQSVLPPEAVLRAAPTAERLALGWLLDRPVYRLSAGGKALGIVDAASGAPVTIDAGLAERIALSHHAGGGRVTGVEAVPDGRKVSELRRPIPAFAVRFDDAEDSVFYVDAGTGELVAVRTGRWRLFDLMWGLHIMDWRAREDFNHPLLIASAALGLASVCGGAGLLLLRLRRRKGGARPVQQG
jgi:uncharacterized iron-regulated membrane protein